MTYQPEGNTINYPRYDFEILDSLILEKMNPEHTCFEMSEENMNQSILVSQVQHAEIKRSISSKAFASLDERQATWLVRNYQVHINYLIDALNSYDKSTKLHDQQYKQIIEKVREHLESMLLFLNSRYDKYFDFEADASSAYKKLIVASLQTKLDRFLTCMPDQRNELLSIFLKPIWDFLSDDYKRISYHKLLFFERILDEVIQIERDGGPIEKSLKYLMIRVNFNSIRFFAFLTREVKKALEERDGYSSRFELLSSYLKKYNQIHLISDLAYNPRQKHIKELITNWIFEEIDHMERSQRHRQNVGQNVKHGLPEDFKIQTELSVAQIGYLVKLFYEVGVIKNQNQSELLKFVSGFVRTKQVEIISAESLRTKFYNVEGGTRDAVKDIVIRLLNQINKKT